MNTIGTNRCKIRAADFEMETTLADRILLPYRGELWADLLHATLEAALPYCADGCEHGLLYDEAIRETETSILFNVQRRQIRATAYVTAITTTNEQITVRIQIPMEHSELVAVLDSFFFTNGGAGLSDDYCTNYIDKYKVWRSGVA